jgi:hypothetical protein
MVARERLLIKNVHGRAGDLSFAQHFKEIGFDHDWSARVFTSLAVGFIRASSAAPTRPRERSLRTMWMVRISACRNS